MRFLVTKTGYSLFAVSSAFQKSIRRGLEEDAIYWAIEMYPKFEAYLWRRIKIISSEDIGLAEPNISANISALYQLYKEQKEYSKKENEKPSERIFIVHAVLLLARAKKSRIVDHVQCYFFRNHGTEKREVPDYALDKHTIQGKAKGRGFEHFFTEGAKLNNMADLEHEQKYFDLAKDILLQEEMKVDENTELF